MDSFETKVREFITFLTRYLHVKIIRDNNGVPFLYRYHVVSLWKNGPGICIHNFVKSDPGRGFHDHPWNNALSFILCGNYQEKFSDDEDVIRNRFTFNLLYGNRFHRVIVKEEHTPWTFFIHGSRTKTWNMISLDTKENKPMSTIIKDTDAGWWKYTPFGKDTHERVPFVISTVDCAIIVGSKILLIKRGKEPFKGHWALPGGRVEVTDDSIMSAALRELEEETNIKDVELLFHNTVGNIKRDPRGFTITTIFVARLKSIPTDVKAGDDAIDFKWFPVYDLPSDIAFDHENIISKIH